MQVEFVEINKRNLDTSEWLIITAIFVKMEKNIVIYYAPSESREFLYQYGHDDVLRLVNETSHLPEILVVGGVILEYFENHPMYIRGDSGAFPDKLELEKINALIRSLIKEVERRIG